MEDDRKTKKQLIDELNELRQCVAELKGFEEEIKQTRVNHEKFTKAFLQNSIPASITTLEEGRFVDVSDAFLRLMGRKRDEVVGHTSTESGFITEEQRVIFINELNKYGRVENLEMKVRTKDGVLRYGLFNAVMMSLEKEKYLLTVMADITDRKQAEKKLRESDGKLNAMLQSIPDHMSVIDKELNIIWANETATRMFGDDIIGRKCYEAYHRRKEPCEPYPCITLKAFKDGGVHEHNTDVVDKEGRTIYFQCTANVAVRNGEDKPITVLEISRDITESKRAEEALRVSEENFRRSMDDSPMGIRIATIEGDTIYANRAILDIHGYESIEDLISTPAKKRYTPESYAEFKIRREKRKRGDYGPSEYEISIVRKDGEVRYLQVFRKRVLWGGERHFQVIYRDITEQKRAEKTLQLITDNMSDLIRVTDLEGVNLYTSPSLFNVLGYKPEERVGKLAFDIVHPDDLEYVINAFSEGLVNKKPAKLEYRIKHAEGHYIWLETIGDFIMDDYGEITAVIQSSRDITERKRTEEALRESEEQYRILANNIPDIIYSLNSEGNVVSVNSSAFERYGYSEQEAKGKPFLDFVHPDDREILTNSFLNAIEDKRKVTTSLQFRIVAENGVSHWFELNAKARFDNHDRYIGEDGVLRDITERKQAEKELKLSNERLVEAQKTAKIGDWEANLLTDELHWSQAIFDIFGLDSESFKPSVKEFYNAVHPDDRALVLESEERSEQSGLHDVVHRIIRPNGEICFVHEQARRYKDDQGKLIMMRGTVQDITERKLVEKSLRKSEERYHRIADTVTDYIFTSYIEDGKVVKTVHGPGCIAVTRYSAEEFAADPYLWFNMVFPEDRDLVKKFASRILTGKNLDPVEHRIRRKDGRVRWVLNTPVPFYDASETLISYDGLISDITHRKRAEAELLASEERFKKLFVEAPLGIALIDSLTGHIYEVNPMFAKIAGRTMEEMVQIDWMRITHPDDVQEELDNMALLNAGEINGFQMEKRYLHHDGAAVWINMTIAKVKVEDKVHPRHFCMIEDITDRKKAEAEEEKLEAQNRQLQKAESLGRMAASIAHTFNNQLGAVIGNLEMAIDDLPKGSGLFNSLTAAMQAAQKSAEVSGMMLTYLGQSFDNRKVLELAEVCRRNLPILKATLPGNAALETSLPSPGPIIMASESQLHQVLMILITNAWEAMGKGGGSIHLGVKTVSSADITDGNRRPIDWQPQDSAYACMEVTDAGCGIADDDIEKLFDPFFSSKFAGRGLGLPVALGIVKAHDGVITIESQSGRGSTFRIFLPVSAPEEIREPNKMIEAPAMNGGGTILLVEDEEMVRNMAAAMLKRLGFSVLEAKDGVEAVEIFRQRQDEIRLVLSDLTMPRMDGWETLTALRKLAPGIPAILASGYDKARFMAGDHPELPQIFLSKPYKLNGLRDAISQAIGQQQGKR